MEHAEVVVVGLGAMGSASAYQLARRGVDVVGIDRYRPPHTFGSTHGDTRVTRQAAGEGHQYVPLVVRSQELWREIEGETGADLFTDCGVLILKPDEVQAAQHGVPDRFQRSVQLAESFGISHETFDGDEVRRRYPELPVDDDYVAYFEPGGGLVLPEAAVAAQLELADRDRARLHYGEEVLEMKAKRSGVVVLTNRDRYHAGQVVVAAGPWVDELCPELDLGGLLSVYRQVLYWWPIDPGAAAGFAPDRFPVFIWTFGSRPTDYMYGFPAIDGPSGGIKIATEVYDETTTPANVCREVTDDEVRHMYDHYARRIPALRPEVLRAETCLYTVTPDYHFVIDRHPASERVLLVSPCSGHGFKHSAAIGESVAQLITEARSGIDLSSFALRRFDPWPCTPSGDQSRSSSPGFVS